MPNPVFRLFVGISTFIAAAAIVAATAGVAAADPDPSGNGSEPDPGVEAPSPSEPQPTTGTTTQPTPPSIFDIPQTIANQLRDMFGRPLSVFGNGRVPGTHTEPDGTAQDPGTVTGRKHDRPTAKKAEPPPPDVAEPEAPAPKPRGSVNVVLPFVPSLSVPIPPSPVAGSRDVHLTLDLTDPVKALASVQNTLNTVNSLLADAYAPYDPTRPPAPKPATTFRTLQEEPDVVDADGAGAPEALATGSSRLPVLQVPVLAPQARIDVPRPVTGMSPGGAQAPQAAGSPPVEAPAPRPGAPARLPASAPRPAPSGPPGSAAEPPPPRGSASALVNSAPREGYPQYLRSARLTQVATVALPGLGGLVALTASGGVIGYRQANSGRYLRSDAARFLQ